MQKNCKTCNTAFLVRPEDTAFYAKMDMPPPALCPACRRQRRAAWRNERNYYRRTCDLCQKSIISCYSADKLFPVYCVPCWWSDKWDAMDYGRDFDFNRPFFEQFSKLEQSVPHYALFQEGTSENCEYTNYGLNNKSCYMGMCASSERVYYSWGSLGDHDCVDMMKTQHCQWCYECTDCVRCTNLLFSENCYQAHDSAFLINCQNVKNCFGSINLKHKEYVFLNQQLTEDEYKKKMETIHLDNNKIQEMLAYMKKISEKSIHRSYHGQNNENSTGDYLDNTKNCHHCFDVLDAEDCSYCSFVGWKAADMWDVTYGGVGSSFVYESMGIATQFNNVAFHIFGRNVQDAFYNHYCFNSHHLFGCVGLDHKQYVILNKQYSESEYSDLMPKIIEYMKSTGEWGEFFPIKYSLHGYNETIAQDSFPLTKEEVLSKGWSWHEAVPSTEKKSENDAVHTCAECKQTFLVIEQEKKFYTHFSLPIPNHCSSCRHARRFKLRNPRTLYNRQCAKCPSSIQTTYSPERSESVYCEQCYLSEIY